MGGTFTRRDRVFYKGSFAVALLEAPRAVTFPQPMPSMDYDIYLLVPQTGALIQSITNKTQTGFTMSFSVNLAQTVTWVAIETMTTT